MNGAALLAHPRRFAVGQQRGAFDALVQHAERVAVILLGVEMLREFQHPLGGLAVDVDVGDERGVFARLPESVNERG